MKHPSPLIATLTLGLAAASGHAQLVHCDLAGQPGVGASGFATAHGVYPLVGTSPTPVFNPLIPGQDPGYMLSPGGGFPMWGNPPLLFRSPTPIPGVPMRRTANQAFSYSSGPQAPFGFGGARTLVTPLGGTLQRTGVALTALTVADTGPLGTTASMNIYTHTVDYVNIGPRRTFTLGHAVAVSWTLGAPGDFACGGLNCRFDIGTGVGNNFVVNNTVIPAQLFAGSDGAGGRADVVGPGRGPGLRLLAPNVAVWIQFATVRVVVPAGGTVRMIQSQTAFLDPSSAELIDFPPDLVREMDMDLGFVSSRNARDIVGACSADCDGSTGPGTLDIFDFLCFQNRYAAGDPFACDFDISTGAGVCDIFDFLDFQNAFASGCP